MITPAALQYAVTVTLKEYAHMELILLKGHLVLEQMLNSILVAKGIDSEKLNQMNLMFSKTLELSIAISGPVLKEEYFHLKEINRIRNKAAHELFFDKYHEDLKNWACLVLEHRPKTINSKRTYKNHVIKAFAFLAGKLQGISDVITEFNGVATVQMRGKQ